MWAERATRARLLADRYPASREILLFYAGIADWQEQVAGCASSIESLDQFFPALLELVIRTGPPLLGDAARAIDPAGWRAIVEPFQRRCAAASPADFFARVALQPYAALTPYGAQTADGAPRECPWCRHPPQAGALRAQGEGQALELVCSLCLRHWPFPRTRCPSCGESRAEAIGYYSTEQFPHIRAQACDTCRAYLHHVDLGREPAAIADVDELAALPLDLWAQQRDYRKIHPNLAGV